ncbi:mitochondrial carrier, partial [Rhizoclosmatium globosum]
HPKSFRLLPALPKPSSHGITNYQRTNGGTLGGIAQVLSGQPFDTVKVRLQTQPDKYNGALDCIRQTLKHEGPFAFYKGTLTPLIGIGACVAVQFAAMESAKRKLSHLSTNPQLVLSGAFSGIATAFLSCPIEHVRSKLQVQTTTSAYKGPSI